MTENATHSYLVRAGNGGSLEDLARLRTAPEFTMQAVAHRTGVPPDTLRSWERRHGFPIPVRNDSNRRLYSERDIAAIAWLRDQTEQGQGTSEAVTMLLSRLASDGAATPAATPAPSAVAASANDGDLREALLDVDLAGAQQAWDRVAHVASVESLIDDVILPAHRALSDEEAAGRLAHTGHLRAMAFLERKATALLDHAGPDTGHPAIALATTGNNRLQALSLAVALGRAGFRIVTPIVDIASVDAIAIVRDVGPALTIIVADGGAERRIASFTALIPGRSMAAWSPEADIGAPQSTLRMLPASPADVARLLRREL